MPSIYREKRSKINVDQSLKTSFPILRYLAPDHTPTTFAQGELVGRRVLAGQRRVFTEKVTAGNEVAQAKFAIMRLHDTTNDALESGAITCIEGLYYVTTELYLASGSYAPGDRVTLRFDAQLGRGVFGPVVGGTTTHVLAEVVVPPANAAARTPMQLKVYPQALAA
jgi:hypothetical protein